MMEAQNPFKFHSSGNTSPSIAIVRITPSDSADQPRVLRDIRVGAPGNVVVIDTEGNEETFANCLVGERLGPFAVARVKATGTTASALTGYV